MTPIRLGGRRSKYGAVRQDEDGYKFDSTAERNRYRDLKLMQMAGEITDLQVHPKFAIAMPNLYGGKIVSEKICDYSADFSYHLRAAKGSQFVVEDVKGFATAIYKLKKRMMEVVLGITVREVDQYGNLRERGRKKKERDE